MKKCKILKNKNARAKLNRIGPKQIARDKEGKPKGNASGWILLYVEE
jgi:hypothetical protein